jgi:hypothetical protein
MATLNCPLKKIAERTDMSKKPITTSEVLVGSPPALWQGSSRGQAELFRKVLTKFIANPADVSNLP